MDEWKPAELIQSPSEAVCYLLNTHQLKDDECWHQILDSARLRYSREQGEQWDTATIKDTRFKAREDLEAIIKKAKSIRGSLIIFRQMLSAFEEVYGLAPTLMQEIAEVGPGDEWFAADELQCFGTIKKYLDEQGELQRSLTEMVHLPLRSDRLRARIPNRPLQTTIAEIRACWIKQGLTWKTEALQDKDVRKANDPTVLLGRCERFVCDLLRVGGFEHNLDSLSAAMGKR